MAYFARLHHACVDLLFPAGNERLGRNVLRRPRDASHIARIKQTYRIAAVASRRAGTRGCPGVRITGGSSEAAHSTHAIDRRNVTDGYRRISLQLTAGVRVGRPRYSATGALYYGRTPRRRRACSIIMLPAVSHRSAIMQPPRRGKWSA
jgi:hypothetical protein